MNVKLIAIGNSRGLRLPKKVIDQYGLSGDLELVMREDELAIKLKARPRRGWEAAFSKAGAAKDNKLLLPDETGFTEFDRKDWTW